MLIIWDYQHSISKGTNAPHGVSQWAVAPQVANVKVFDIFQKDLVALVLLKGQDHALANLNKNYTSLG